MKKLDWKYRLGIILVIISATMYSVHFSIFKDSKFIFKYLIAQLAFLPVSVLFVTLIMSALLRRREKKEQLNKLNMIIGTFYSEIGTKLITFFRNLDPTFDEDKIRENLKCVEKLTEKDFSRMAQKVKSHKFIINSKEADLISLKEFLSEKKVFLVNLLQNGNLLEHETFTELLWATFHIFDELNHRKSLDNISEDDYDHLAGDMERAYSLLVFEWIYYMHHLRSDYPYLFNLAVRTNPFFEKPIDPNLIQ